MQLDLFTQQTEQLEDTLDYALQLFDKNLRAGIVKVSSVYDFERLAKLKIEIAKIKALSGDIKTDTTFTVQFI